MRHALAIAAFALLAGCVAPSAPPPAPARPAPVPPPAPAPAPPAASSDWRDWPVTPGNWSYRREGQGKAAVYGSGGAALFSVQCDAGGNRLILTRGGMASGAMTIRTTSTARTVAGPSLPANDSLIDAMGYSRGRFIVETSGLPPLVIPAWAEVLRVAEDCRR